MKILISPSKGYKLDKLVSNNLDANIPVYISNAEYISKELSKLTKNEIKKYYKLKSDDLVNKVYNTICEYALKANQYQALNYYNGVCFKEIERSDTHDTYYNKYLKILSAKYGILSPGDLIAPYRLDFTVAKEINYFNYYMNIVHNNLANEDFVINLASEEFSRLLNGDNFVTITFLQKRNNEIKKISNYCKKARGTYLTYLASNKITNKDQLKDFDVDGYKLVEVKSNEVIFLKELDT